MLQSGAVGVMPTDTILGVVGSALRPEVVERIYRLKKRDRDKPLITLIGSYSDLSRFHLDISPKLARFLTQIWPGPVTVIFPLKGKSYQYLSKDGGISLRLPKEKWLRDVLNQTGPLIATSANLEGEKEAESIEEAFTYFRGGIDFYEEDEMCGDVLASTIIKVTGDEVEVVRQGSMKV